MGYVRVTEFFHQAHYGEGAGEVHRKLHLGASREDDVLEVGGVVANSSVYDEDDGIGNRVAPLLRHLDNHLLETNLQARLVLVTDGRQLRPDLRRG